MQKRQRQEWSDGGSSEEELNESDEEELAVALEDPDIQKHLSIELKENNEEEAVYAGERMKELVEDISWGESNMWNEGLVVNSQKGTEVEDVENDLERELAFYNQAMEAALVAIHKFESEGVKWRRPDDYMAEMVKSDAHMAKVKEQLVFEQKVIEDAEQRKKERENKKYAKQVAAERKKERSQQKKQAIESVSNLRKTRAQNNFQGEFDMDHVLGGGKPKGGRLGDRFSATPKSAKKSHKDAKFGFGGPKRKQKQNDAYSAAGGDFKRPKKVQRPGKSRRQQQKR